MTTVHFVYPHKNRISTPDAIGFKVAERLRRHFDVVMYEWIDTRAICPGADDILVGHPHPIPWTTFNRSVKRADWSRKIALSPFSHGYANTSAFQDILIAQCDVYLAITGNYWFNTINRSLFAHWAPKIIHVDLAVDRADFPLVKHTFNPPEKRRFVYIGHTEWYKNTDYLSQIAGLLPEMEISWIGSGRKSIPGVKAFGRLDFSTESARQLIAEHDFLITVGSSDANPTTILEAMAWGLIPVCTPQSGYENYPGIINVPLNNVSAVVEQMRWLQQVPEAQLRDWQAQNLALLDAHFNWDRFAQQVIDAINSDSSPTLGETSLRQRLMLRYAALASPHFFCRPRHWRVTAYTLVQRLKKG